MEMYPLFEPSDVFNRKYYGGVRQAPDKAVTLPGWCYTSQRFYERERERIFFRYWNCIGHQSRVPSAGSYFTQKFMGVPLIVVRGEDMKIRAFVNSCPHRGSEVAEGSGTCTRLVCPYHNWAFRLDGELYATPMWEEAEAHGFQKSKHGLQPVKLELWAGLMWINFNPDSPSLLDDLGDLPERTTPWRPESLVCVARTEYPMEANWKLFLENFSDGLHVPFVHKTTLNRKSVSRRDFHDPTVNKGNYLMHYTRFEGTRGVRDGQKAFPEIDMAPEHKTGSFLPHIHANAVMGFAIDSVTATEIHPLGPERSLLVASFLVPKSTTELPDFEKILGMYVANSKIVRDEDVLACERQQKGLSSAVHVPGCYHPKDRLVYDYKNWILDHVLGNEAT
jgi:choline monooxygenase